MGSRMSLRALSLGVLLFWIWLCIQCCTGKEIELTSEWQLLGENDTLPAGAHIRMDLSSGGRWAKLPEDGEGAVVEEVDIDPSSGEVRAVREAVDPSSSGGVLAVAQEGDDDDKQAPRGDYDYDMMHRTLSNLPPDEQERMGGLPELPGAGTTNKIDPAVREQFEARMKEIWEKRQAELASLQEELMADLPKMLHSRIKHIKSYLQDPYKELSADWSASEQDGVVTNVLEALQDVEDHMADVDRARDFHTLNGWPALVSLLSDDVHQPANHTLTPEMQEKIDEIQAHAAWAIGTAVKNIDEFHPYALEQLSIDGDKTKTPIDLLVSQIGKSNTGNSFRKKQKFMYALGSLLRGNREAQAHFCSIGGPKILGQLVADEASQSETSDPKLIKRVLALADDIVADVVFHPQDKDTDSFIVESFATEDWCQSAVRLLDEDFLQETTLRFVSTMVPYCKWDKEAVKSAVERAKSGLEGVDEEEDSEHLEERLELVDSILKEL